MHYIACAFYTQSIECQFVKLMLLYTSHIMFWESGAL